MPMGYGMGQIMRSNRAATNRARMQNRPYVPLGSANRQRGQGRSAGFRAGGRGGTRQAVQGGGSGSTSRGGASPGRSYPNTASGHYQQAQDRANAENRRMLKATVDQYQAGRQRQLMAGEEGARLQLGAIGQGGHQRGEANQMAALGAGERAAAEGLGYDLDMGTVGDYQKMVGRGLGGYVGAGRGTSGSRFQGSGAELATMGMSRRAREVTGMMERNAARRADVGRWGGEQDARTARDRANIMGQYATNKIGAHRWGSGNVAQTTASVHNQGPDWQQFAGANRAIGGGGAYGGGGGGAMQGLAAQFQGIGRRMAGGHAGAWNAGQRMQNMANQAQGFRGQNRGIRQQDRAQRQARREAQG